MVTVECGMAEADVMHQLQMLDVGDLAYFEAKFGTHNLEGSTPRETSRTVATEAMRLVDPGAAFVSRYLGWVEESSIPNKVKFGQPTAIRLWDHNLEDPVYVPGYDISLRGLEVMYYDHGVLYPGNIAVVCTGYDDIHKYLAPQLQEEREEALALIGQMEAQVSLPVKLPGDVWAVTNAQMRDALSQRVNENYDKFLEMLALQCQR